MVEVVEMRDGFKKTEVGVIPSDWEVKELGEICYNSKERINPVTSNSNEKCVELEHLSQGTGVLLGYVDSKRVASQKSVFKKDDVLFGKLRPYLRKFLFADFDGICTTEIWVLKAKSGVYNHFLYYLIQTDRIFEAANISFGTKMPRADWKTVAGIEIPFPSTKSEQTNIATALNDADLLIARLEKIIAKKRAIKQGAMQEMLRPKEGWEVKSLGDVARFRRGSFPQPYGLEKWYDDTSGFPFVQVFDVDNNLKLKPETKRRISEAAQRMSVFVEKGSVLLTIQGSIGRIAITQYNAYVDRTLLLFESFLVPFNKYFFMMTIFVLFEQEKQRAPGGTIKTITKEALSSFTIAIPPIEEQNRIAQILSEMDAEIEALEKKLDKNKMMKQGMMQNLLTGKIRLV